MSTTHRNALALVAAWTVALALAACDSQGGHFSPSTDTPMVAEQYLGLPVEPLDDVEDLDLPFPGLLAVGPSADRVWLGAPEGLAWLDVNDADAHVVDRLPGAYLAFVGDDTMYRAGFQAQSIAKYDLSGQPREVSRGAARWPLGVAATRDVLWLTNHRTSTLLRLDPDDLRVTQRIQLGHAGVDDVIGAGELAWVGDTLWMISIGDPTVYALDGHTGNVLREVSLGAEDAAGLKATSAGLWSWVGNRTADPGYDSLVLVDPDRGTMITRVPLREPADLVGDQVAMVSDPVEVDGEIWVAFDQYVVHLDAHHDWRPDRVLGLPDGTAVISTVVAGDYLWYESPLPAPHVSRVPLDDLAP
jgi:hypothetical protein